MGRIDHTAAEGKSKKEVMRCLKRHLSNAIYRPMVADEVRRWWRHRGSHIEPYVQAGSWRHRRDRVDLRGGSCARCARVGPGRGVSGISLICGPAEPQSPHRNRTHIHARRGGGAARHFADESRSSGRRPCSEAPARAGRKGVGNHRGIRRARASISRTCGRSATCVEVPQKNPLVDALGLLTHIEGQLCASSRAPRRDEN